MILKTIILTALVSSVTDTEEAATGGALKIQIKVPQNLRENTYARVSFLIKLQGPTPVNFVKFLRIPFRKATVSQDMKAFKLQVRNSVKLKIGWIDITIKISNRKTSKISSRAYIFQWPF